MDVIDNRKKGVVKKVSENSIIKKIKGIKNIQYLIVIFVVAIALLVYSSVTAKIGEDKIIQPNSSMSQEEKKLASILSSIEGAGLVETLITEKDNEIVGVLVIAEGAQNITVMLKLLEATTSALGVDKQIVSVYKMNV